MTTALRPKYDPVAAVMANLSPSHTEFAPPPLDWKALSGKEPPARRWAIADWVGYGHGTLLSGSAGLGKTLLAQQIGSCLSIGRPFIGHVLEPTPVLFLACEDDADELWRRQTAIARWLDVPLEAFTKLHIVPRLGMDNTIVASEYGQLVFTGLLSRIREQAHDLRARVVILDNVAQLFGGNENDRHQVTVFMNAVIGALAGCAVLLLAHPSRALGSEFSGSSAWEAVARTRLYLGTHLPDQKAASDEEPSDDVRYLARRKANYSSKDWRRFTFRGGVLVADENAGDFGAQSVLRMHEAERVVLEGMRRLVHMGLEPTDSRGTERYLPRMLGDYKLAERLTSSELAEAMRRLMKDGKLQRAKVGRYGNRGEKFGLRIIG